ncbi:MAG: hypothetical protein IPK99_17345 [Flavobacteriales bacterium]|nr:hypothetical protein [Flavobacteriales bacterium]
MAVHHEQLLCQCAPRSGRLLPPRELGKALRTLLAAHWKQALARYTTLARTDPQQANSLKAQAQAWMEQVRRHHLTPHHLRVPRTDRFSCWALPECVRRQLLRQLAHAPQDLEPQHRLRLLFIVPVTPTLRLLDKLAVYLRAPHTCPRTGRHRPMATGQWWPLPMERVHAELVADVVVVLVE